MITAKFFSRALFILFLFLDIFAFCQGEFQEYVEPEKSPFPNDAEEKFLVLKQSNLQDVLQTTVHNIVFYQDSIKVKCFFDLVSETQYIAKAHEFFKKKKPERYENFKLKWFRIKQEFGDRFVDVLNNNKSGLFFSTQFDSRRKYTLLVRVISVNPFACGSKFRQDIVNSTEMDFRYTLINTNSITDTIFDVSHKNASGIITDYAPFGVSLLKDAVLAAKGTGYEAQYFWERMSECYYGGGACVRRMLMDNLNSSGK